MSYDFMMFRPVAPITAPSDLGAHAVAVQDAAEVVAALNALVPGIAWDADTSQRWFGSVLREDGRYEFSISTAPDQCWTICASHRASERSLVAEICRALGLIAFDGQAMEILRG